MVKIKIDAMEALIDIRNGMSGTEIMRKYGLSIKGLNSLMSKLQSTLSTDQLNVLRTTERKINAREVVADIKAGMTESDLMEKYRISALGLNSLLKELIISGLLENPPARRQMKASVIMKDILDGYTEDALMKKYNLSFHDLTKIVHDLYELKLLDAKDLLHLSMFYDDMGLFGGPRKYIPLVPFQVYDALNVEKIGEIHYFTSAGLCISGLNANFEEVKTLVIQSEWFQHGKPLVFDAKCLWIKRSHPDSEWMLELKIVNIAPCILREFKNLIASKTEVLSARDYYSFQPVLQNNAEFNN